MHQRVVVVAGEGEVRDRLFEAFESFAAEAIEAPSVRRALELAHEIPIDLLTLRYPIDDMSFADFQRVFRESECASRGAQVVVLAPGKSIGGLKRSAGPGVAFLRAESDPADLAEAFKIYLRRSPRFSGNMLVGAELDLPSGKVKKMLQVVNLSETGMLLRTKAPLDIGSMLRFELQIPELDAPIAGTAEVVRMVEPQGGRRTPQAGVRFLSLAAKDRESLARFLEIRRQPPALAQ